MSEIELIEILYLNSMGNLFWYLLGTYDGIIRGYMNGYIRCFLNYGRTIRNRFAQGWLQGKRVGSGKEFTISKDKWVRSRNSSGRFISLKERTIKL